MNLINLLSIGSAMIVIIIYGIYFFYFSGYVSYNKELNTEKRLKNSSIESIGNKETKNLSLLKTADPDTYFKSKLPKIEGLKEWIQHAGLEIRPGIFITVSIVVGIISGFIFFFALHMNFIIAILLAILSTFFFPWVFIAFFTAQRKKKFLEDFPVALDIIRRSLRAGHSIDRSIGMVVEELSGPVQLAFKQLVDQLQIGVPFEKALADLANSIGINDFRMLAIVMVLQRETGGSLAEAIDNFAKIIRARQFLRKKVKSLTAEVRMTAMILAGIPFFIFGVVYLTTPTYFNPLFYTDRGQIVLWSGIFMLVLGIGIITRMTYKESY
jgi:tight adherence protein B